MGLVVGVGGAGVGVAVAEGGGDSAGSPQTSTSSAASSVCELTDGLARLVESGLSEEDACARVRESEKAMEARQGPPDFPEGPSLVIEGTVNEEWVKQCRTGSFPVGEGYEAAELYCNAILKIAAGELEPTGTCGPPACPEEGTPLWEYGEAQLRDLPGGTR